MKAGVDQKNTAKCALISTEFSKKTTSKSYKKSILDSADLMRKCFYRCKGDKKKSYANRQQGDFPFDF
jgi:hypothetical protein